MINAQYLNENAKQIGWTFNEAVILFKLGEELYTVANGSTFIGDNVFKKHVLVWDENYQFTKQDAEDFKALKINESKFC